MIKLSYYNPCEKESINLKSYLQKKTENQNISVKFNDSMFITNIKRSDINIKTFKNGYSFNEKDFLQIRAGWCFYKKNIRKAPKIKLYSVDDYELSGILKNLYAQIEFGFVSYKPPKNNSIKLLSHVFKSLYTKSPSIKKKNIDMAIEEYNKLKREGKTSIYLIRAMIYMVYDYYHSVLVK